MLSLEEKKNKVEEITLALNEKIISNNKSLILFNFNLLSTGDIITLKRRLKRINEVLLFKVFKNSSLIKSIDILSSRLDKFSEIKDIKGNNLLIVCDDAFIVSKTISEIFPEEQRINQGIVDKNYFNNEQFLEYIKIPYKEKLIISIYRFAILNFSEINEVISGKDNNKLDMNKITNNKKNEELAKAISDLKAPELYELIKNLSTYSNIPLKNVLEDSSSLKNGLEDTNSNKSKSVVFTINPLEGGTNWSTSSSIKVYKFIHSNLNNSNEKLITISMRYMKESKFPNEAINVTIDKTTEEVEKILENFKNSEINDIVSLKADYS